MHIRKKKRIILLLLLLLSHQSNWTIFNKLKCFANKIPSAYIIAGKSKITAFFIKLASPPTAYVPIVGIPIQPYTKRCLRDILDLLSLSHSLDVTKSALYPLISHYCTCHAWPHFSWTTAQTPNSTRITGVLKNLTWFLPASLCPGSSSGAVKSLQSFVHLFSEVTAPASNVCEHFCLLFQIHS